MTAIVDDFAAIDRIAAFTPASLTQRESLSMTKTPAIYDFAAIGKTLSERPAEKNLATLWRKLDEMTDLLVDGDGGLSEQELDQLNAQALKLEKQIVTSPAISLDDVWGKFKLLETMMDDDDPDPDQNVLRVQISFALQNLATSSGPQPARTGDEQIMAAFARWCLAERAVVPDADGECDTAMLDAADDIMDEIEGTPASGAAGLAIKLFFQLRGYGNTRRSDAAALGDLCDCDPHVVLDLVRLAPVLEPLCRGYFAALVKKKVEELTLPPA